MKTLDFRALLAFAVFCAASGVTLAGIPASALTVSYDFTDCGTLPGQPYSQAVSINERGQVLCNAWSPSKSIDVRPFVYHNGVQTILKVPSGHSGVTGVAINYSGDVVGDLFGRHQTTNIIEYVRGVPTILTTDGASYAIAINNSGVILGYGTADGGRHSYFLLSNGVETEIPNPVPDSTYYVSDVDDSGSAVGYCATGGAESIFEYSDGTSTLLTLPDGSTQGQTNAIANNGDIMATISFPNEGNKCEIYSSGVWTPIFQTKPSTVVGGIWYAGSGSGIGSLGWEAEYWSYVDGRIVDLSAEGLAAGWGNTVPQCITRSGWIACSTFSLSTGVMQAVLATPVFTP